MRRITKLETDLERPRPRPATLQRKSASRSGLGRGRDRRVHERRQVDAAQPAHRRRRADRGPPVRHARPDDPAPGAARRRAGAADRHRRLRAQPAARPRRGVQGHARGRQPRRLPRPRRRRQRRRPARARSTRSARCSTEIDAADVPELLVFNKADLAPRRGQAARRRPPRLGRRQRGDGRGHRRRSCARSPTACGSITTVVELPIPYDRGDVLASIHREGEVVSTTDEAGDLRVRARLSDASAGRLGRVRRRRRPVTARRRWHPRRMTPTGFVPPPYPYDRLDRFKPLAAAFDGGARRPLDRHAVDPPPAGGRRRAVARRARARLPAEHRHGRPARGRARAGSQRRFDVDVPRRSDRRHASAPRSSSARCRSGCSCARPTATPCCTRRSSYPTYEMGAILAGCRPVAGADDADRRRRPRRHRPGRRRPGPGAVGQQPGQPDRRARRPRRRRRVGPGQRRAGVLRRVLRRVHLGRAAAARILEHGLDGVVAVHSLSKRSNLAGGRVGFYAGDPELVHYLQEVRKHVGMMVPGPAQAAGVVALDDDDHVEVQRDRYRRRLERMADDPRRLDRRRRSRCRPAASTSGSPSPTTGRSPSGWPPKAARIVSPGEFYGAAGPRPRRRGTTGRPDRSSPGGRSARRATTGHGAHVQVRSSRRHEVDGDRERAAVRRCSARRS